MERQVWVCTNCGDVADDPTEIRQCPACGTQLRFELRQSSA
jgi:rubrerythrin